MKSILHVESQWASSSEKRAIKSSQLTNISKEMPCCQGKRAKACWGLIKRREDRWEVSAQLPL
jgi:hypothetical protein